MLCRVALGSARGEQLDGHGVGLFIDVAGHFRARALENDHEFLLIEDVFTADVIHYWIKYKRENEVDAIRVRPHPFEFCMYFDI